VNDLTRRDVFQLLFGLLVTTWQAVTAKAGTPPALPKASKTPDGWITLGQILSVEIKPPVAEVAVTSGKQRPPLVIVLHHPGKIRVTGLCDSDSISMRSLLYEQRSRHFVVHTDEATLDFEGIACRYDVNMGEGRPMEYAFEFILRSEPRVTENRRVVVR